MFAEKNFDSKIPPMELQEDDIAVLALVQRELTPYVAALEKAKLRDALRHILAISKHGNQYMQSQEPWVKIKGTDNDKLVLTHYFFTYRVNFTRFFFSFSFFFICNSIRFLFQFFIIE